MAKVKLKLDYFKKFEPHLKISPSYKNKSVLIQPVKTDKQLFTYLRCVAGAISRVSKIVSKVTGWKVT